MKKIAVCGYTSSVGKCFIEKNKKNYQFVKMGRGNDADIFVDLLEREIRGDTQKLIGCAAIINFATVVNEETGREILDLVSVNVLGTLYLAEITNQYHIPQFISMSSISASYSAEDMYYGFYAQSKKSADEFLMYYCKKNHIALSILRPAPIYGEESFAKHQKLLYGIIKKIKNNETVTIYGTQDVYRNYIHINTLSEILRGVIEKNITGVFNVVNGKNQKLTEIVKDLNGALGGTSDVIFLKDKPNVEGRFFSCDNQIYNKAEIQVPMGIYDELTRYMFKNKNKV